MVNKMRPHAGVLAAFSVLIVLASGRAGHAQASTSPIEDAQVTFYSNPITVSGGLPGRDLGAFKGRIFDGDHQLAFLEPGHFVTFRISPGLHDLSAASWMNSHSKPGAHITMNIGSGQQYFVECGTTSFGPIFVIRDVACTKAQIANQKTKALEAVHVRPDGKPILVSGSSFPKCQ
jgi:hypothetical protein